MDAKSDDSAGSDSLDKSLQKKCVVDDNGGGGGGGATSSSSSSSNISASHQTHSSSQQDGGDAVVASTKDDNHDQKNNSTKHQRTKTEKMVENSTAMNSGLGNLSSSDSAGAAGCSNQLDCSKNSNTAAATNKSSNNNNAFETKVTQISKNLKETTLAETASSTIEGSLSSKSVAGTSDKKDGDSSSASSSSSSSSSSTTPESEILVAPSAAVQQFSAADDSVSIQTVDLDGSMLSTSGISDSNDENDNRSKKVRFHPDAKENDGGNRIIPKKKKKLKATPATGDDAGSSSQNAQGGDDEMDLDEEDECEEEDEFDLEKTIAEAQDYLKEHPLTFVRPCDKNAGLLQNGLLEEEDLPQLSESSEEEDFYENILPENGVERILGKQNKCGKVEFLLRYADRAELAWENEEVINKLCPNLLNKYEQNRERRQERLMRHVAKRQNLRQRYTDF